MNKVALVLLGLAVSFALGLAVGRPRPPAPPTVRAPLVHVVEQLRQMRSVDPLLPCLSLAASGMAGRPDPSYLLYRYVVATAGDSDLKAMLADPAAPVRVVAAMAILKPKHVYISREAADRLLADPTPIVVYDNGCIPRRMTVGAIVAGLKQDPDFMDLTTPSEAPAPTAETAAAPAK